MTDKQPESLRLAGLLELAPEDGVEPQTTEDAAAELRRLHAENEALASKLKAYEDLDEAASDVQLLRMGYAAARLEIESLQARIKAMAEERADELVVAHLDGRMRASHGQAPAQAIPAAAAGCTRSHPHENMDSACRAKAAIAEMQNMAARGAEATTHDLERFVAMLAAAPTTQPAPQQEAQEPVAWYVTGCNRLLDEDEAKAEARHIGGTARAMPLYTAPPPSPASQADSQPALDEATAMNRTRELAESGRWPSDWVEAYRRGYSDRAARAPADSVLEDAARLDWLDQNIFYREMDEWDAKHGRRGDCNMWVMFAPKGHQGSARNIIDAARKQGANHD